MAVSKSAIRTAPRSCRLDEGKELLVTTTTLRRRCLSCALCLVLAAQTAASWATTILQPPVLPYDRSATISSPWGPRINPVKHAVEKHPGIDYPSANGLGGDPIQAVEAGTIVKVDKDGSGDWYIGIKGATATFLYLHIFDNAPVPPVVIPGVNCVLSCVWHTATLKSGGAGSIVDLVNLGDSVPNAIPGEICFGVAFWGTNGRNAPPDKVLTSIDCAGGSFAGTLARGTVGSREVIAPVGNSGMSTGPHVHLDANWGRTNPLVYVDHQPSNYAASFYQSPQGGSVYVDVIYTQGWDLDGAVLAVTGINSTANSISIFILSFGGSPFAPDCSSIVFPIVGCQVVSTFSDGETLGILPTSEKGRVKFVLPVPAAGFPQAGFPCNHQSPSCGGPPAVQDLPTYGVLISPYNVCAYESPDPLTPFYYRGPPQTWIQLPNQTNVIPQTGALFTYAPQLQLTSQSCPFGVAR